jgi:putative oxidoreductase
MKTLNRILCGLSIAAGILVVVLSGRALVTQPIDTTSTFALTIFLCLMATSLAGTIVRPGNPYLLIAALFCDLVVGRLFSTMHTMEAASATATTDPLFIAETGPGIPSITYASLVLCLLLAARLTSLAINDRRFVRRASIEQLGCTALRIYVGLMFIAHFAGHLFGGAASFKVFTDYFGSIGLPLPGAFVILAGLIEMAVAIGLAFGLTTRLAAAGAAVYLFISVGLGGHYSVGYVWVLPTGGWEFPALWIFSVLLFTFVGGGPISLDTHLRTRAFAWRRLFA